MRTFVASLLLLTSIPSAAAAQYVQPGVVYAPAQPVVFPPEEQARLLARSNEQLRAEPLPADAMTAAAELELIIAQRNDIDIAGITALQWIGAIFMIAGGAFAVLGGAFGGLIALLGSPDDGAALAGIALGAGGGAALVLGLPMVLLAELDGNLHRRRAIDSRIDAIRLAQRRGVWGAPYATADGVGLGLVGAF